MSAQGTLDDVRAQSGDGVRNAVLATLLASPDYVSGETLCKAAGVTRTAVWKHIHNLESLGFVIEKRHGVGYRVASSPDLLLEPLLQPLLPPTIALGKRIVWKTHTQSTNQDALELARADAPHGTIVTALTQQGGRGRNGRVWSSPAGGLWQSFVIRQPIPLQRAAEVTLIASVAVRRAVEQITGLPVAVKWPNDLLVHGRKICGILAEIKAEGENLQYAVLGIGLNTNVAGTDIPSDLRQRATSLWAETGTTVSHLSLEARLLAELDPLLGSLADGQAGFGAVSEEWRTASATLGQHVRVATAGNIVEGEAIWLDDSGVLHVQTSSGVTRIMSGDVLFN